MQSFAQAKSKTTRVFQPDRAGQKEGRLARKRRETRARLLKAAYETMSQVGVDAAKIKDVTDRADTGFGTFYNYFASKDDLAAQVLDCLIDDCGRRNIASTEGLRAVDPRLVIAVSVRLVLRQAVKEPIWQWWALRPDLLVDRMVKGFISFARRDIFRALADGLVDVREEEITAIWTLATWTMVGGIHDIVVGESPPENEQLVAELILRLLGVGVREAERLSSTELPTYFPPQIDWHFRQEGMTPPARDE